MIDIRIGEVQEFFFKAMREDGYSGGGEKIKIPQMPGYEGLPFRDGDFSLLDCWCVTPHSRYSAGTTTIWYKNDPVWWMQYSGWYAEEGISFLKRALHSGIESHEWLGGRGPRSFKDGKLEYANLPLIYRNYPHRFVNEFKRFEGYEHVFVDGTIDGKDVALGQHHYSGLSLL